MARGDRELKVKIVGDSTSAEKALKRTADATDRLGPPTNFAQNAINKVAAAISGKLGPAAGTADSAFKKMSSSAGAAGAALSSNIVAGATAAGGALVGLAFKGVQTFLDLAEEVRNFQRVSGASARESSHFVAVLDDLKISSESGATAMFKLGREVASGAPKLREFGIEVARNADGSANLTETLLNVADAYSKAPDQATRTSIAFAAFGKQAQGLLPILEKGRVGLRRFFEGAREHGQTFSQQDLENARELELAIDDLQDAMRGIQLEGARALTPFLTSLSEASAKSAPFLRRALGELFTTMSGAAGPLLRLVAGNDKASKSTKELGGSTKELGKEAGETSGKVDELGKEMDDAAASAKAMDRVARVQAAALDLVANAAERLIGTQQDAANATADLTDKREESVEKERALAEAIKAHGSKSAEAHKAARELDKARRGEVQTVDALAKAQRDLAIQQAEQAGLTVGSADKYRIYRNELIKLKDQTAAGSPLRRHLVELINQLPPPEVAFKVKADTAEATAALLQLGRLAASIRLDAQNAIKAVPNSIIETFATSGGSPAPGGNVTTINNNVTVHARTNASGEEIAREVSWRGRSGWR